MTKHQSCKKCTAPKSSRRHKLKAKRVSCHHEDPFECQKCDKSQKPLSCRKRNYRDHSNKLRCALGKIHYKRCPPLPLYTDQDKRYKKASYNGSFHKTLTHDLETGRLLTTCEYQKLCQGLKDQNPVRIGRVNLYPESELKLVNPTASLSTVLEGSPQCRMKMAAPPTLSSKASASEMVELYSQAVARDVPFIEYDTSPLIAKLLGPTYLNDPKVLDNLPDSPSDVLIPQSVFRGNGQGCLVGPYISQALLLEVPTSEHTTFHQKYTALKPRYEGRVEWGVSSTETINIENGVLNTPLPSYSGPKYVFDGRSLAEAVHYDIPYQYYYQAARIFQSLGVPTNPTFPKSLNADAFVTGDGVSNMMSCLAQASNMALVQAWYQKWCRWRRLRPEVYGLWVDNVKNDRVENAENYDLSSVILESPVLEDIKEINVGWGSESSYTLPLCFREGSPSHPSYPAGHAVNAGACATMLKIFFDGEAKWSDFSSPVQADADGENLIPYDKVDAEHMNVGGEVNKLAYNIVIGRDWAGVHYRSDGSKGIELGEQVAIDFFSDVLSSCVENNLDGTPPAIKFRRFNGDEVVIRPTLCHKKKLYAGSYF